MNKLRTYLLKNKICGGGGFAVLGEFAYKLQQKTDCKQKTWILVRDSPKGHKTNYGYTSAQLAGLLIG